MAEESYKFESDGERCRVLQWVSEGELLEFAATVAKKRLHRLRGTPIESAEDTANYVRQMIGHRDHEVFGCLYLDSRHRIIRIDEKLFRGTIDGCVVHIRVLVQEALKCNAAAIVIFHQHPSGSASPSQADGVLTHRIRDALSVVDIRLLDHLIVGGEEVVSMTKRGLM